jgi:hypothetical protein
MSKAIETIARGLNQALEIAARDHSAPALKHQVQTAIAKGLIKAPRNDDEGDANTYTTKE